jgi:hypothetical protein
VYHQVSVTSQSNGDKATQPEKLLMTTKSTTQCPLVESCLCSWIEPWNILMPILMLMPAPELSGVQSAWATQPKSYSHLPSTPISRIMPLLFNWAVFISILIFILMLAPELSNALIIELSNVHLRLSCIGHISRIGRIGRSHWSVALVGRIGQLHRSHKSRGLWACF